MSTTTRRINRKFVPINGTPKSVVVSIVIVTIVFTFGFVIYSSHHAMIIGSSLLDTKMDISVPQKCDVEGAVNAHRQDMNRHNGTILERLSNRNDFFPTVTYLYSKYGEEIAQFRPDMRKWCEQSKSCKFCDYEVEMLYMLIREIKPQRIFEMAPNRGYSTTWMLHAVSQNDDTSLVYSYDLHAFSVKYVPEKFRQRWHFTKGDYAVLLQQGKLQMDQFDFIFIDALHEEEFSRNYCQNILEQHKRHAIVAIHDIVADPYGGGRESAEVYKWMAFATHKVQNAFTMSRYLAPNMNYPMPNYVSSINQLRVKHNIVKPCVVCNNSLHDVLYFENGDNPTIFFELNP